MIHDVDKTGSDRATPMPNTVDPIQQRPAHGTFSLNLQTPQSNSATSQGLLSGAFRLVFSNTITIVNDGSTLTTYTDTHGLGYVPMALAAMNNSAVASANGTVNNASIFLPVFLDASIGGDVSGVVTFRSWLYHFVDSQKVYINMLNATGSPRTAMVTYYLYQQPATG